MKLNNIFVARDRFIKNYFNQNLETQHIKKKNDYLYLDEGSENFDSYDNNFFEYV